MTSMVAVDPGAVRWGVALFNDDQTEGVFQPAWHCTWVAVLDRDRAQDWLEDYLHCFEVDHLVYERWRLRVDKAKAVAGDDPECGTAESVGVIKWLVRKRNQELERNPYSGPVTARSVNGNTPLRIELHRVETFEKEPAAALCRTLGIKSVAKQLRNEQGGSTHDTLAAELIGWAWLFKTERVALTKLT